jgi:hypothetical protein
MVRHPVSAAALGLACLVFAAAFVDARPAGAQQVAPIAEDLADRAHMRLGPFYFQPWIALTNAGYDTNVFNDYAEPKEDFTFTLTPALDGGMRAGPARLNFRFLTDYVWYRTYKSEQGVDGSILLQFELRYHWLRPHVSGEWVNTRSRPGYEIDARAERNLPTYEAGADLRLASRTWAVLEYRHGATRFLEGEVFQGVSLDQALNNTTQTSTAGVRFELTPLTTLSLLARLEQVRFDSASFRDNESWLFVPTLNFSPDALLAGQAAVGYRSLTALTAGVPDFRGVIANVALRYSPLPSTSIGFGGSRDIAYSYETAYPYYLLSEVRALFTQRIVAAFELTAQGRLEWLDFSVVEGLAASREDSVAIYGGGAGYRMGDMVRVGVDVEWSERQSDQPGHSYQGTRIFGSFRYGF